MERCPKCGTTDIILAELDFRGCKECGHWWEYDGEALEELDDGPSFPATPNS
jgi:hypothetical protein